MCDVVAGMIQRRFTMRGARGRERLDDAQLWCDLRIGLGVGEGPRVLVDGRGGARYQRLLVFVPRPRGDRGLRKRQCRPAGEDGEIVLYVAVDAGLREVRRGEIRGREDAERRVVGVATWCEASGRKDALELAGADDGVDLRDVGADLVAIALDQAAGDDEAAGAATVGDLVLHHLEDGVDALLLGGVDERAGVDYQDLSVLGLLCELGAVVMKQAHHDLGVDEVLGAAERDEADLGACRGSGLLELRREDGGRSHSLLV